MNHHHNGIPLVTPIEMPQGETTQRLPLVPPARPADRLAPPYLHADVCPPLLRRFFADLTTRIQAHRSCMLPHLRLPGLRALHRRLVRGDGI